MLLAGLVCGQGVGQVGIVRGTLASWKGTSVQGEMQIQRSGGELRRCTYDARTMFDRDGQMITIRGINQGERLDIVADTPNGPDSCVARSVHVISTPPAEPLPGDRQAVTMGYDAMVDIAPRGNLIFTGIVREVTPGHITIRTPRDGLKTLTLRRDTRFIGSGFQVGRQGLALNTEVFIRAGHNFENQIEVYQVVWGKMFPPR